MRRILTAAVALFAALSTAMLPTTADAAFRMRPHHPRVVTYTDPAEARAHYQAPLEFQRQVVTVAINESVGTIMVDTSHHFLYLMLGDGKAMRYGIGVARTGFEWSGTHHITNKREWPGWTPPAEMKRRVPGLPDYMPGGIDNPLGARALYIGSTLYRIHGTNEPWTIGGNVSSGCIRLTNDDVIDLYTRVKVGAKVIVM